MSLEQHYWRYTVGPITEMLSNTFSRRSENIRGFITAKMYPSDILIRLWAPNFNDFTEYVEKKGGHRGDLWNWYCVEFCSKHHDVYIATFSLTIPVHIMQPKREPYVYVSRENSTNGTEVSNRNGYIFTGNANVAVCGDNIAQVLPKAFSRIYCPKAVL